MCGISGVLYFDNGQLVDRATLERMCQVVAHRGPDDSGIYIGGHIGMAVRRLSIIDLTGGHQPIWNEDQTCCIVYNGELYNFLDIRPELESKGHIFCTRSDTEVILHAYEEWGVDCLCRFNGMFAIAIWDERRKILFLARDRIGEKPLYYYRDDVRLVFASEIKSILADATIPRQLNFRGLSNFLAFGRAVAPETIYRNISKLLPGHYLVAQDRQIQICQYWDVGQEPQLPVRAVLPEAEYAERILDLLDDSVHRRMIADVPIGAFLSGGMDSSTVVALMKRHATGPVKTFSLGFSIGGAYNELADARRVAKYLGTEHYELQVEHVDLVQTLRTLVYHYDEPFGDAAAFPIYLLSHFARERVKVVLAGDGGDELFGGYRRYVADQFASLYQCLPTALTHAWSQGLIDRLPRLRRIKRIAQVLPIKDAARRYATWLMSFTPDMQASLLRPEIYEVVQEYDPAWSYPHYYDGLSDVVAADHLNRLMYVDLKTWLADAYMEKTDKATMACSLEARLPFLDHRLVELAFQIPSRYKIRGNSTKRILKRAVNTLIPADVLHKPKHGFAVPTDPWFRGNLRAFTLEILLDDRARHRGYFNIPVIERLWKEHIEGRHVWDTQLWLLLNFELWHRIYLDGETV
jgi:asparagine synthase (glutamine-hydrolysing)